MGPDFRPASIRAVISLDHPRIAAVTIPPLHHRFFDGAETHFVDEGACNRAYWTLSGVSRPSPLTRVRHYSV